MAPQFCPQCAAPLALALVHGREREHCPDCGHVIFHNPAPVGLAVIEDAGRLVLIRRSTAPLMGYWAPPAGYVEVGESVPQAVVREAREESGLDIVLHELLGIYSRADVRVLIVAYRASVVGGSPVAGDDASEIGLFAPGELPQQAAPLAGTPTDYWFHDVIRELTAPWQQARHPASRERHPCRLLMPQETPALTSPGRPRPGVHH